MRAQPGRLRLLAGNKVLLGRTAGLAEVAALERIEGTAAKIRRYDEFRYAAKTWSAERRVIARVEALERGADSRFVVTNLAGAPRWLYEDVYCARGQAENRIKAHKRHLASDRSTALLLTLLQGEREPIPARPAHRRLLAAAHPAWFGAEAVVLARGPVRHDPAGVHQGGRSGHRARNPDQSSAAVRLPLPRQPDPARRPRRQAALSRGAACPDRAHSLQPPAPITAPSAPPPAMPTDTPRRPRQLPR